MSSAGAPGWWAIASRTEQAGGLPVWRQALEALALKVFRGIGPRYYHVARLGRPQLRFADKWAHLTQREYDAYVDALNAPAYQKVSQHKVTEKAVLSLLGLPTPRFLGFFHTQRGMGAAGQALTDGVALAQLLQPLDGQQVCFKRVEGFGGAGFAALKVDTSDGVLRHPQHGESHSFEAWAQRLALDPEGWLIEEHLPQHEQLAWFNASSLNTLRLWVLDDGHGTRVTHAMLRVGRRGEQVDNTTHGGMALPVDVATGTTQAGPDLKRPGELSHIHPDSGLDLAGRTLPFWPDALDLAVRSLHAFPHMHFAGLDVAIAPDGPRIIELNVCPDRISSLRWDLPLRAYFKQAITRRATLTSVR